MLRTEQIINTVEMIQKENLDVRTVTLGLNLMDCRDSDGNAVARKVYDKVVRFAGKLVPVLVARVKKNGEFYQDITFILLILYIPLAFFSLIGCFYTAYGSGSHEVLSRIFSGDIMAFFYPTRVLV